MHFQCVPLIFILANRGWPPFFRFLTFYPFADKNSIVSSYFIVKKRVFLWGYIRINVDWRTDGHLRPTNVIRSTRRSRPNKWASVNISIGNSRAMRTAKLHVSQVVPNPAAVPPQKFLLLLRYNLFMGVNEMRVKILPLLCRLGLVLRLGSV